VSNIVILSYAPPEEIPIEGKFLQLVWLGVEYLVFAPAALHRYHNQILARFCEEHGIPHRWLSEERLEVDSAELAVIGGGRFRADTVQRRLELWDNSQAYGRFAEHDLPSRIAAADHPWSRYTVEIA
jgi:hypothetical protein